MIYKDNKVLAYNVPESQNLVHVLTVVAAISEPVQSSLQRGSVVYLPSELGGVRNKTITWSIWHALFDFEQALPAYFHYVTLVHVAA